MPLTRRTLPLAVLPLVLLALALVGFAPQAAAAQDARSTSAEYLYELAVAYRRTGHLQDAAHELRKALLVDPAHPRAARELAEIQALIQADRERAMSQALAEAEQRLALAASKRAIAQVVAEQQRRQLSRLMTESAIQPPPGPPPAPPVEAPAMLRGDVGWPLREQTMPEAKPRRRVLPLTARGRWVRVPSPWVNGASWFYVFGPSGRPDYGALDEPLSLFVDIPRDAGGPVTIRVLDADIRGRHDEQDGGWDTSTTFRVSGGATLLDSTIIEPGASDGTTVTFGPFRVEQGEPWGDVVRFRVDAEGVWGNDNNLFALEVSPAAAQVFAMSPAVRLAETAGEEMRFFPAIPEATARLVLESNYDLDADGGRAWLVPVARSGRALRPVPLAVSGSGTWSSTAVDVPPGADGTRWIYRIIKGTQRKANMAFRLSDGQGTPLPIYATRGRAVGAAAGRAPTGVARWRLPELAEPVPTSCATFTFDASGSSDPDDDRLGFRWDFGDGTTAEGADVTHTYARGGDVQVRLTVDDGRGTACSTGTAAAMIRINSPPVAKADPEATKCAVDVLEPLSVILSAIGSSDSDLDRLAYRWDFGDGTTGEGVWVSHAYARGGRYTATLTVDDGRGTACSTATAAVPVRVNRAPRAALAPPAKGCPGEPVAFDATGSSDPDGDMLTYRWDFGDRATGEGGTTTHRYAAPGHFPVTVTVDDGSGMSCGTATASATAEVNALPVPQFTVRGEPAAPLLP